MPRSILSLVFLLVFLFVPCVWSDDTCSAVKGDCPKQQLLSEEAREKLATKLNSIIDVPILNENHEQVLAEMVIDMVLDKFAQEEFEEMKKEMKRKLVRHLNENVDIPFASEKMEAQVLSKVVDFVLKDRFDWDTEKDEEEFL